MRLTPCPHNLSPDSPCGICDSGVEPPLSEVWIGECLCGFRGEMPTGEHDGICPKCHAAAVMEVPFLRGLGAAPKPFDEGAITFYEPRYYIFSNFSSFHVFFNGRRWPIVEHAYQAAKFLNLDTQRKVRRQTSAHDAMKFAQGLPKKHKDEWAQIRPDWAEVKVPIMTEICRTKLSQHAYVRQMLRKTGSRILIEASPIDSFWGWGPDRNGLNHLGKIWMLLRGELPAEDALK